MDRHDAEAAALIELGGLRSSYRQLTWNYFNLRQSHLNESPWWIRAGAGSPHELSNRFREELAEGRPGLRDYWYFPSGKHNPYLDLLYCELPVAGLRPVELPNFAALASLPSGSVAHLHWIESLRPDTDDEAAVIEALERARGVVMSFVSDPANTLVWSVHEPLPHGSRWPLHDARFHQLLADQAQIVHLLHPSTVAACASHFTIDETKTVVAELPLYSDVYPSYRTRASARAMLGVAPDELCVAFFGALRPYKGLTQLLDSADAVADQRALRLLIAGMPVGDVSETVERIETSSSASVAPLLVPDVEIQTLLRAADVLVVPYQKFLNSAVLMLGLSFGVPVVASQNPVTVQAESSGMVTTFETQDELTDALLTAAVNPDVSLNPDFLAAHNPHAIGTTFAQAVIAALRTPQ